MTRLYKVETQNSIYELLEQPEGWSFRAVRVAPAAFSAPFYGSGWYKIEPLDERTLFEAVGWPLWIEARRNDRSNWPEYIYHLRTSKIVSVDKLDA